jgi:hypothetical protein
MDLIKVLTEYRDKCYISAMLCQLSADYYSKYKHIIQIPIIVSSSVFTILNSSDIQNDHLKYANCILNSLTALLLALSNNFKIIEKASQFKSSSSKFTALLHKLEDSLIYNESLDRQDLTDFISQYDMIYEALDFSFPEKVKQKCINMYKNTGRSLPNVLNCTSEIKRDVSIDVKIEKPEEKIESSIVYSPRPRFDPKVLETRPVILDNNSVIA